MIMKLFFLFIVCSLHLSKFNSFKFYLSTINNQNHFIKYLSKNNRKMKYENISDMVCFHHTQATYHLFTLPFEFIQIFNIGNLFPNMQFNNVIELWTLDVVPFEHEFFLQISRAFPLLKRFIISDIKSYEIIKYPHLVSLDLTRTGVSCTDQFLNENKTYLLCSNQLRLFYKTLRITTENFPRQVTKRNCANITQLITNRQFAGSKDYYAYFPLL